MLPVRLNNQEPRNTRARSRKNEKGKVIAANGDGYGKASRSRAKSKKSNCANNDSDTCLEPQPSTATNPMPRKPPHPQHLDKKTTQKKTQTLQSKPLIRDFLKRLPSLSKQYVPEYFISILQYMIQRESTNSMRVTVEKINGWRIDVERARDIQGRVRREMRKMGERIVTGRKRFREGLREGDRKRELAYGSYQDYYELVKQNKLEQIHSDTDPEPNPTSTSTSSSSQQPSLPPSTKTCPSPQIPLLSPPTPLTQKSLHQQWQPRYEQFCFLIQEILSLVDNESQNTIYPACYIFYVLVTSDVRVFQFLGEKRVGRGDGGREPTSYRRNQCIQEPTAINMIQYYTIISILISTKYHEIYPASLTDLIQSINPSLSYSHSLKLQAQTLQLLSFTEFFSNNEHRFLLLFHTLLNWSTNELCLCQFVLQSGLCNPRLYGYSPLWKAVVVIGMVEREVYGGQEGFVGLKGLCAGLGYQGVEEIRRGYVQSVVFNRRNNLVAQKNKYVIFQKEVRKLGGDDDD